jgi:hypothetical protein
VYLIDDTTLDDPTLDDTTPDDTTDLFAGGDLVGSDTDDEIDDLETHDRWSSARWADGSTRPTSDEQSDALDDDGEPGELSTDAPVTIDRFASGAGTHRFDDHGRPHIEFTSLDDAPWPGRAAGTTSFDPIDEPRPEPALVAPAVTSWSDIFDIFQDDDDTPALSDAPVFGSPSDTETETEPFFIGQDVDIAPVESPGDRWASTLLDRLRSVVATPTEPSEALDEFDARFGRGLRLRLTDQQVIDYLGLGVNLIAPDAETQVLLASAGEALDGSATAGHGTRAGCGVRDSDLCPAIVQGETLRFDNSSYLDACPQLTNRGAGACAAVCVPLPDTGGARGVVHITTLVNATLPDSTVEAIEQAAALVGERLVQLRTRKSPARSRNVDENAPQHA